MNLMNETNCRFCDNFNSNSADPIDTPWLRNSDYCALVSKGALVPGWSLICPLRHGYSLADNYQSPDFWSFSSKVEAFVRARYGDVRLFEHGARFTGSLTGCGTDHAHLHMVPLSFNITIEALRYDPSLKWSSCRTSDIAERSAGLEYLFVSDQFESSETTGLLCILKTPISQYFRRVVASRLGLGEFFDYRRHPMLDISLSSSVALRSDALPEVQVDVS